MVIVVLHKLGVGWIVPIAPYPMTLHGREDTPGLISNVPGDFAKT